MRYSVLMRRCLFVVVASGALLWAGTGVSVLLVALHEHSHHADQHDHHEAVQAAMHGHAHEDGPFHHHHLSATPGASRVSTVAQMSDAMISGRAILDLDNRRITRADLRFRSSARDGTPAFLMHCALLT